MPFSQKLDKQLKIPFYEIVSMLSSSYLFKIVEYDELQEQYEKNDHGILSALCLLLSYYNGGLIQRLNWADKCAIELAAYSIFAHTRSYRIQGAKNARHGRPIFVDDPFAFLLRICDDLQEWQRLYFYVSDNTNSLICQKCYSRLVRTQVNGIFTYACSNSDCDNKLERITSFQYKKINYLCVCDSIDISVNDGVLCFILNYDYLKLLEILDINHNFAAFRKDELLKLAKILINQAMFPKVDLKFFLSNNHKLIKLKIVNDYLNKKNITLENLKSSLLEDIKSQSNAPSSFDEVINAGIKEVMSIIGNTPILDYLEQNEKNDILKEEEQEILNLDYIYFYKLLYNFNKQD